MRGRALVQARPDLRWVWPGRGRRETFAQPAQDVAPAVLLEVDVHRPDAIEDLVGDPLLLVALGSVSTGKVIGSPNSIVTLGNLSLRQPRT